MLAMSQRSVFFPTQERILPTQKCGGLKCGALVTYIARPSAIIRSSAIHTRFNLHASFLLLNQMAILLQYHPIARAMPQLQYSPIFDFFPFQGRNERSNHNTAIIRACCNCGTLGSGVLTIRACCNCGTLGSGVLFRRNSK